MLELRKKYKSGSAAEILREAILTGDIPENISITQNEIAESLGTSRMPVREALISLEYQGLITRGRNQHIQIVSLSDEYICTIFNDMAILEIESLKQMTNENLKSLSECENQINFHRMICEFTHAPLRKKMLEIFTEIYFAFVIERSDNVNKLQYAFMNLKQAMKNMNPEVIQSCYDVYSKILSDELMNIRRRRMNHA